MREAALGYLLVLPALCVFAVFVFYPFVRNFKLALYQTPPYPDLPSHYVGLHQVGQVLRPPAIPCSAWSPRSSSWRWWCQPAC